MSTIAPNDPKLLYSPYNWLVTAGAAKTANAGAYIRAGISGGPTSLTATFDVSNMNEDPSHVGIRIDGGSWVIAPVAASITIPIPADNTWGTHFVELVMVSARTGGVRWAAPQDTAIVFTGFTSPSTISTTAVRPRPLHGLIIGDSITEGIKTRTGTTGAAASGSSLLAWAHPLGDMLGAEIGVAGWSGQGIVNGGGGGVPNFANAIPFLWQGQARPISAPKAPDFVACHIGTNDSSQTDAAVTAGARDLLNYLLANTPASCPVIVFPGWLQTKKEAIAAAIASSSAPARVTMVDTTGWWSPADSSDSLHPYGYINLSELAPRAATAIRGVLGAGGAAAVSNIFRRSPSGQAIAV